MRVLEIGERVGGGLGGRVLFGGHPPSQYRTEFYGTLDRRRKLGLRQQRYSFGCCRYTERD